MSNPIEDPIKELAAAMFTQAVSDLTSFDTPKKDFITAKRMFQVPSFWSGMIFNSDREFDHFCEAAKSKISWKRKIAYVKFIKRKKLSEAQKQKNKLYKRNKRHNRHK